MYLLGFWRRWVLLSDAGEIIGETKLNSAKTELYNQFADIQQGILPSPILQLIRTQISPSIPTSASSNSSVSLYVEHPALVLTLQKEFNISVRSGDEAIFQQYRSRTFHESDLPENDFILGYARWQLHQKQQTPEKILIRLMRTYQRFERTMEFYREKLVEGTTTSIPQLIRKNLPLEELETTVLQYSEGESSDPRHINHLLDIKNLQMIAIVIRNLHTQISQLELSIGNMLASIAPNLKALLGNILATELISKAGGLSNLVRLPAGHIQLLGSKTPRIPNRNPKYGIIYKATIIGQVPVKFRARIARSLSAVIAIAVKADYYTHSLIFEALNAKLARRVRRLRGK